MYSELEELQLVPNEIGWDAMIFGNVLVIWRDIQKWYDRTLEKRY
jgi:hypothetical protein